MRLVKFNKINFYISLCILLSVIVTPVFAVEQQSEQQLYKSLFEYDSNLPLDVQITNTSNEWGSKAYKIKYKSVNDQIVPGILIIPKHKKGDKLPCIILQHGLGGKKEDFKWVYQLFLTDGYALLTIDAPLHGERANKRLVVSELFNNLSETRNLFIQQVIDLRRAVDYLSIRSDIDSIRIGYLGISLGAIIGTVFCGVDQGITAAIMMVGGGNWSVIGGKTALGLVGEEKNTDPKYWENIETVMRPVDPIVWAGLISPKPILFINGEDDTIVVPEAAKALQNAANEPKEIVWYKGNHMPPLIEMPNIALKMAKFLAKHLKGSKKSE